MRKLDGWRGAHGGDLKNGASSVCAATELMSPRKDDLRAIPI